MPILSFNHHLALSLLLACDVLPARRSRFPDAALSKQAAALEQATARGYDCVCLQVVA
jgi:hypothetical protein